jgi:CubicO group peptidase (beta-lactamase class C family)
MLDAEAIHVSGESAVKSSTYACIGLVLGLVAPTMAGAAGTDGLVRARALELPTSAEPPPGDPRLHYAAGLANVLCSAVFITGLDPDFALENVGGFTAPFEERSRLGKPVIDRSSHRVRVPVPGGPDRVAELTDGQGCVALPLGDASLHFTPERVTPHLPPADTIDWPMGDREPATPLPAGVDRKRLGAAVDAAFASKAGQTAAFIVTWKGRIIAERYAPGITMHTPLESWSMGKSVTAALMGILIRDGIYGLWDPAPIPEWQTAGDPRNDIRIADLLRMSSGLRIRAPYDPDFDPAGPYPEHYYLYTSTDNAFHYAATRPLQWPPNTVGRYRNTDPVLVNYLIRLGTERAGRDYLSFPQRALFDRIGIRDMVIETDPYGNLLTQGYDLAAGRDWARLGNLFLNDGVWMGERILPAEYTQFVRSLAPAWIADGRPVYGGFFWINGDGEWPVPTDAYYMAGAGGQYTWIIPSHDLVVVRLGHYRGNAPGDADLKTALGLLMKAVPRSH